MSDEVWVLGGAGRSGRGIASALVERGHAPVLVGRDAARLAAVAAEVGDDASTRVAADVAAMAAAIRAEAPQVVVNTVGPFATTTAPVVSACLAAGSHYCDLANDVVAVQTLLDRHADAVAAGVSLVSGAGFGVTATESVVVALCTEEQPGNDHPEAARVRVDMVPSLATEAGPVGEALAATMLDGFPDTRGRGRYAGRVYRDGRLVRSRLLGAVEPLRLPDGTTLTTAAVPFGELVAAQRASGAPDVVSASSELPHTPVVRALLPMVTTLLAFAPLRNALRTRLARTELKAHPKPRPSSYGHARVTWADGTTREGWLRLDDASAFTVTVAAEVAHRLAAGDAAPGAGTPAATFGTALAEACGAEYLL